MFQIQNDLVSKMGIMISSKLDLDQEFLLKLVNLFKLLTKSSLDIIIAKSFEEFNR